MYSIKEHQTIKHQTSNHAKKWGWPFLTLCTACCSTSESIFWYCRVSSVCGRM